MTLIDTNVLVDLFTNDERWATWSRHELEAAALRGPLFVNDVIYAEISVRYARIEEVDETLAVAEIEHRPFSRYALFLAGKAFRKYRASGGPRRSLLPDFFIGAHAAADGLCLLTRDPRRYRTHFPGVALISPAE